MSVSGCAGGDHRVLLSNLHTHVVPHKKSLPQDPKFDPDSRKIRDEQVLPTADFIEYVLVPDVADYLIAQDIFVPVIEAIDTKNDSQDFGERFPALVSLIIEHPVPFGELQPPARVESQTFHLATCGSLLLSLSEFRHLFSQLRDTRIFISPQQKAERPHGTQQRGPRYTTRSSARAAAVNGAGKLAVTYLLRFH
ncbi:hypothetical protein B0H11DRAFT_2197807, partial [Mycena galericulata]